MTFANAVPATATLNVAAAELWPDVVRAVALLTGAEVR
jgi:hypothetical protein